MISVVMDNARRAGVVAALLLAATTAHAMGPAPIASNVAALTEPVRLVCDQDCRCWHTAYPAQRSRVPIVEDINACPAGGRYNGHYRTGPSVGLGFESRVAKPTLFPFY